MTKLVWLKMLQVFRVRIQRKEKHRAGWRGGSFWGEDAELMPVGGWGPDRHRWAHKDIVCGGAR